MLNILGVLFRLLFICYWRSAFGLADDHIERTQGDGRTAGCRDWASRSKQVYLCELGSRVQGKILNKFRKKYIETCLLVVKWTCNVWKVKIIIYAEQVQNIDCFLFFWLWMDSLCCCRPDCSTGSLSSVTVMTKCYRTFRRLFIGKFT